jgi:hypothetical protein
MATNADLNSRQLDQQGLYPVSCTPVCISDISKILALGTDSPKLIGVQNSGINQ